MTTYPHYPQRLTLPLDGTWRFAFLGDANLDALTPSTVALPGLASVPGVFDVTEPHHGQRGVAVYRRDVHVPFAGMPRMRLRIGALGLRGKVWWDDQPLGDIATPYSPAEFDFDVDSDRPHRLTIAVDNRFDAERSPLFPPFADFYAYGGIFRSVTLTELPDLRLDRVAVTVLDPQQGTVRLTIRLQGHVPSALAAYLRFDDGGTEKVLIHPKNGEVELERDVPNSRPWTLQEPNLHRLTVSIDGDEIVERFGIRRVHTADGRIVINGEPIVIKGVNRHEAHPQFGPVQSVQSILNDLLQIKALGCNFVRAVHYPPDPAVLDLCDELGLLVWAESLAWGLDETCLAQPATRVQLLDQTRQMVREGINHPSVIVWAFLNECSSDAESSRPLYAELADAVRGEDHTRLVSYASNRGHKDGCFDLVDVVAVNLYPGWIAPQSWSDSTVSQIRPHLADIAQLSTRPDVAGKPLLVTEIGACGLYGCRDRDHAQWSEDFQADFMVEACRAVLAEPRYAGVVLWQFCDTRSFVGAGSVRTKPRGFNCAGLVDEYRRPKLAYDAVREVLK